MHARWLFVGTGTGFGFAYAIFAATMEAFGGLASTILTSRTPVIDNFRDISMFFTRTLSGSCIGYGTFVIGNLILTRKLRW